MTELERILKAKGIALAKGQRFKVYVVFRRAERMLEVEIEEVTDNAVAKCAVIGGNITGKLRIGRKLLISKTRFLEENRL